MIGRLIGFWVLWFLIAILIGKVWPSSLDGKRGNGLKISFGNGALAFGVTAILFLLFGR